jgi:hypothetical protein
LHTEQSDQYSPDAKTFELMANINSTQTHLRLKDGSEEIRQTHALIQTNSSILRLEDSQNVEFVKVLSQFHAPVNETYEMTVPQSTVKLSQPLLSEDPAHIYNAVRVTQFNSGLRIYVRQPIVDGTPVQNYLNLNAGDYVCLKQNETMLFGIYRVDNFSSLGSFVGSSPQHSCDVITLLSATPTHGTDAFPEFDYSATHNDDIENYTEYGIFKFDYTNTYPRLEHDNLSTVMETMDNLSYSNPTLNTDESAVAEPYLQIYDETAENFVSGEYIRIVKYVTPKTSLPANATELLESAFYGKLLIERAARGTTKNPLNYDHLDTVSSSITFGTRIFSVQFATDYVYEIKRNVTFELTGVVGSAESFNNAGTVVGVWNRDKQLFGEFPVKAYGKGSNRILQNLAVGSGVKLYGQLSEAVYSTSLSGFIISII